MDTKLYNLFLGGGAAASIVLPQALTKAAPQLFAAAAPLASQTLPYCTGVCGACGGTCVGSVVAALWLGGCAYAGKTKAQQGEDAQ